MAVSFVHNAGANSLNFDMAAGIIGYSDLRANEQTKQKILQIQEKL